MRGQIAVSIYQAAADDALVTRRFSIKHVTQVRVGKGYEARNELHRIGALDSSVAGIEQRLGIDFPALQGRLDSIGQGLRAR